MAYPIYDLRTGRRLTLGPPTGAYGDTYGTPIFTGAEFMHVLAWVKAQGFHVYANKDYGGVNFSAHSPKSWHYKRDGQGNSLAADIGTYGDINERARIIRELIPVFDRIGIAWHYARDGHVPAHHDHIHIDVSNWGRKGGPAPNYGYYTTRKKQDVFKALPLARSRRKPKSVIANYGMTGELVKVVQRIVNVKQDGSFGPGTRNAVKAYQRKMRVTADGSWGPATTRAYMNAMGVRGPGSTGYAVRIIQHIAGVKMDGHYGPATTKAVKEMQAWAGIEQDGWFGPTSRKKLIV